MDVKPDIKKLAKQRHLRKNRIIVRNLSFKATEKDLRKLFSKYGTVLDVTIPLMENQKKKGFAFVQFERFNSLVKAMKELNYKEVLGRPIAIDYAVDKTKFCVNKMQTIKTEEDAQDSHILSESEIKKEVTSDDDSESDDDDDDTPVYEDNEVKKEDDDDLSDSEKRVKNFFKEFDAVDENDDSIDDEYGQSGDSDSDEDEESESDQFEQKNHDIQEIKEDYDDQKPLVCPKVESPKKISNDVSEGKTVFIRNLSFVTSEESLKQAMSEFGRFAYCLLCIDKATDHVRGTAFVKFWKKESADELIKKAGEDPGITLDGRQLQCSYAISKEDLQKQKEDKMKKPKDKRNMCLLDVGYISYKSKEAEGVSTTDMKKRAEVAAVMRQKLRHPKFFISDRRLAVHNIPHYLSDAQFRNIFQNAAPPDAIIDEARVMRNLQIVNSEGVAKSKGFGFVSFKKPEDALVALHKINNNPTIFSVNHRPIVEFSVENRNALLLKQQRLENSLLKQQKLKEKVNPNQPRNRSETSATESRGRRRKKIKALFKKGENIKDIFHDSTQNSTTSVPSQPDTKKSRKNQIKKQKQKGALQFRNDKGLSSLINKYKTKLVNKMS